MLNTQTDEQLNDALEKLNKDTKALYKMRVHEVMEVETDSFFVRILRVPGGWVYTDISSFGKVATFVPFDQRDLPLSDTEDPPV